MTNEPPDADLAVVEGQEPPSARTPLSRERIVGAALSYIESDGMAGLTMRRLGAMLGVEAMSLYRHIPGREQLLDAVVEAVLAEMDDDPDVIDAPTHGWQDFVQRMAHGIRRVALAHPKAFPLVASRPTEAPWLRPPLRSVDWVEHFLCGLIEEGFTEQGAVEAYRACSSFLLGILLLEVATLGADLGPLDVLEEDGDADLSAHPTVHRLRGLLQEDHSAAEFDIALEELINRLALIRSEQ
ncbi:TetR family transcriptional regulator [Nocardioides mangrovicus]|uniref:TetR family transcriptional regulator n=1 Tax=Nocardioides mangrovicus TaxID=2478913 RepID=A0A3L8NZK7_9ACTN|nr:TetR/AcrR family transcriptional regulator C-terminal domain-containing protein [Nocardioides mangrovicus]RLV48636.1 TetR family transcriptional regulator [Nocardioides mangrovicus]